MLENTLLSSVERIDGLDGVEGTDGFGEGFGEMVRRELMLLFASCVRRGRKGEERAGRDEKRNDVSCLHANQPTPLFRASTGSPAYAVSLTVFSCSRMCRWDR